MHGWARSAPSLRTGPILRVAALLGLLERHCQRPVCPSRDSHHQVPQPHISRARRGTGGKFFFTESKAEVPDTFNVLLDYPEGVTVQLISSMANDTKVEHMLRGHKAHSVLHADGFEIRPQELFAKEVKPATHQKTGAERVELHHPQSDERDP